LRNYIRLFIYLIVLIGFSSVKAGAYDDFFTAIKRDDAPAIVTLLMRGFDPNTRNPAGEHALHLALREPSPKVVALLLSQNKIEFDARNPQDETPLMLASLKGFTDVATKLMDMDADVNKPGWTPLHYASTNGHLAIMQALLDHNAYIDASSPNASTPLMLAAMYGTPSAVKLLLEAGADPELKNNLGLTAFDFAQRASRIESAEIISSFLRARQPRGQW
jgi:ankyrin repeat protein